MNSWCDSKSNIYGTLYIENCNSIFATISQHSRFFFCTLLLFCLFRVFLHLFLFFIQRWIVLRAPFVHRGTGNEKHTISIRLLWFVTFDLNLKFFFLSGRFCCCCCLISFHFISYMLLFCRIWILDRRVVFIIRAMRNYDSWYLVPFLLLFFAPLQNTLIELTNNNNNNKQRRICLTILWR